MATPTNGHDVAAEARGNVIALKPSTDAATLARLAALPAFEYDKCREREAEQIGVRVSVLDAEVIKLRKSSAEKPTGTFLEAPEPWPEPVDGGELIGELAGVVRDYVILSELQATAIALWVLMSHALDSFRIAAILAIESPEKRCGKTTLLSVLQPLVPKPLPASNMTEAVLFRAVDAYSPTLLVDEADTFITPDKPGLIGLLNSGHNREMAYSLRLVGDAHELSSFSTWGAKVIALIGELPPTLQDRAIPIRLRRRRKNESVGRLRGDRVGHLKELCRKAARWAKDHAEELRGRDPSAPDELNDRAADNWRALLAIADTIGGDCPAKARKAALDISAERSDSETGGVLLLSDCRKILRARCKWLPPKILVEKLVALEEAPWAEWRQGKPITTVGVARLLGHFDIKSKLTHETVGGTARRYYREDFTDAWGRYLPSAPPINSLDPLEY